MILQERKDSVNFYGVYHQKKTFQNPIFKVTQNWAQIEEEPTKSHLKGLFSF